ncbi:hypothetical protein M3Y96_00543400 [Aphelenchoides besseyi]|nr:hypothetical protein M3Y96_00543400 [Aphelenchoides besseyi]
MSTSIDLFGLLVLFWSQSRFKATASYQIIVFIGPASLLNSSGQCCTLMLYVSVPQIDCILTCITALYRHQYIKNKVAPSTKQLLSYLFASVFFIAISAILSAQDYCGDTENAAQLWYVESELPSQFMVGGLKVS